MYLIKFGSTIISFDAGKGTTGVITITFTSKMLEKIQNKNVKENKNRFYQYYKYEHLRNNTRLQPLQKITWHFLVNIALVASVLVILFLNIYPREMKTMLAHKEPYLKALENTQVCLKR